MSEVTQSCFMLSNHKITEPDRSPLHYAASYRLRLSIVYLKACKLGKHNVAYIIYSIRPIPCIQYLV